MRVLQTIERLEANRRGGARLCSHMLQLAPRKVIFQVPVALALHTDPTPVTLLSHGSFVILFLTSSSPDWCEVPLSERYSSEHWRRHVAEFAIRVQAFDRAHGI
jgi:hypothetical protein